MPSPLGVKSRVDSHHAEDSVWYVDYAGTSEQLMDVVAELVKKTDTVDISMVTDVTTRYGIRTFEWLREHGIQVKKDDK